MDLLFGYVPGTDHEMVILQGMVAQVTRSRRRRGSLAPSRQSLGPPPAARPTTAAARPVTALSLDSAVPPAKHQRDCKSPSNVAVSIPLRLLLPSNRPSLSGDRPISKSSLSFSPVLHAAMLASTNRDSLPTGDWFSGAQVEYIGKDCVYHNGTQMVDVAVELPVQRAIPRIISIPYRA
ncbi:hypothetical protein GGH91_000494 [Coemansia sp. RSA 2671]|uniref:Uncharacterized protein n=1 Tax=Coemansia spiralis TaxID=417178 RepID=A0A9W8GLJ8_9FUNG|nr:hypothetical protein LPJ60_000467 [Coemansia sp. RSA 2675]KAJ2022547.1 hypothetical protein GGI06_001770 [Coemansia sp. S85]KAJ2027845.1 hypothetical protein IWW57_002428 [Coemansia sp. S610]KAJ2349959.1 hypothetical protein GGH91_000494 [Coemansia sp. RSA 2671]KAJ2413178.1 hypothetical protein GGI10_003225 [Coemansia sp. RSA 2530]KAJ2687018.1 hypothetical protein IWW39_003242 [Coemansia spiralis]KAJ2700532.1 hypothetical protein H4218_001952 [Coemansia sp. IMI 209128]